MALNFDAFMGRFEKASSQWEKQSAKGDKDMVKALKENQKAMAKLNKDGNKQLAKSLADENAKALRLLLVRDVLPRLNDNFKVINGFVKDNNNQTQRSYNEAKKLHGDMVSLMKILKDLESGRNITPQALTSVMTGLRGVFAGVGKAGAGGMGQSLSQQIKMLDLQKKMNLETYTSLAQMISEQLGGKMEEISKVQADETAKAMNESMKQGLGGVMKHTMASFLGPLSPAVFALDAMFDIDSKIEDWLHRGDDRGEKEAKINAKASKSLGDLAGMTRAGMDEDAQAQLDWKEEQRKRWDREDKWNSKLFSFFHPKSNDKSEGAGGGGLLGGLGKWLARGLGAGASLLGKMGKFLLRPLLGAVARLIPFMFNPVAMAGMLGAGLGKLLYDHLLSPETKDAIGGTIALMIERIKGFFTDFIPNKFKQMMTVKRGPETHNRARQAAGIDSGSGKLTSWEAKRIYSDVFATTGNKPSVMMAMADSESSGRVDAKNPNSSAAGLFQFTKRTFDSLKAKYPKILTGDVLDPRTNALAAGLYMNDNSKELRRLGVKGEIGANELYAAHHFGATGGAALLNANGNANAVAVMGRNSKTVKENPDVFFNKDGSDKTVAQVKAWINERIGKKAAGYAALGVDTNATSQTAIPTTRAEMQPAATPAPAGPTVTTSPNVGTSQATPTLASIPVNVDNVGLVVINTGALAG